MAIFTSDFGASETGRGWGTDGYMSPEQCEYDPKDKYYHRNDFGVKSDVWAIGRVMLSLMHLETGESLAQKPRFDFHSDTELPYIDKTRTRHYPEKLVDLVTSCLRKKPRKRPHISDLWEDVHREVASYVGLRGEPVKTRPAQDREVLLFKKDIYALFSGCPLP